MKYIATTLAVLFILGGCSKKDADTHDDVGYSDVHPDAPDTDAPDTNAPDTQLADTGRDATSTDVAEATDTAELADANLNDASDTDATDDTDADGPDTQINAQITVGGASLPIEHAFYGRTDGAFTNSGFNEYHIELHRGGLAECPEQDSPSPSQTVIVTNVVIPTSPGEVQTEDDGLVVTFLDFFGDLTDEVLLTAVDEKITWVDIDPNALVFEIDAPLDDGAITGTIVATRCESLDL